MSLSRRSSAVAAVLVLAAALLWPTPAAASPTGTWGDLQDTVNACGTSPTSVTLTADIAESGGTLAVGCVVELDLDGHDLTLANVVINAGQQLTISDSSGGGTLTADPGAHGTAGIGTTGATLIIQGGTVTASGGMHGAGIGGGQGGAGGTVGISGGTVVATGLGHAAGIGGGYEGAGGSVGVSGGTVTASGHGAAAGIGGGIDGAGGSVEVSGGTVIASGDGTAAGIGGGGNGAGGDVQIGAGAVVTATGGPAAIGAGQGGSPFGSLLVGGTLHLPAGSLHIPSGIVVTVSESGRILGGAAAPTIGADLTGAGHIANGGAIALAASHVTAGDITVTGHHYEVAFDADGGSPDVDDVVVFASSFETGYRDFPAEPTRDSHHFEGWTDQPDGVGDPVTSVSVLPGSSDDGTAVPVVAHANWNELTFDSGLSGDAATILAGERAMFTPTVTDSNDAPFVTDPLSWTIGDAGGLVDATIDPASGQVTLTSTTAGTYPLELRVPAGGGTLTATVTLQVDAAAATVLHLDAASSTVIEGGQVTITVTGTDEHDNPTGDITDEIVFTSDVATDIIDGNTITFPTASPHIITATHLSGATATLAFEVTPTADDGAPPTTEETPPTTEETPPTTDGTPPVDGAPTSDATPVANAGAVAPGLVPTYPSARATTSSPGEGSLPVTGADPLGMLTAALLMSVAGALLLRRGTRRDAEEQHGLRQAAHVAASE